VAAPAASEEDIWDALADTGADGVVGRLEHGLDTVVGERGSLVSGGERQRIAISRALLRRPSLLLLDEATNALDPSSERALIARIARGSARPTIILVAHREESLRLCDRVILLDGSEERPGI
jgi:ATP-binding cassette subfamily C protein